MRLFAFLLLYGSLCFSSSIPVFAVKDGVGSNGYYDHHASSLYIYSNQSNETFAWSCFIIPPIPASSSDSILLSLTFEKIYFPGDVEIWIGEPIILPESSSGPKDFKPSVLINTISLSESDVSNTLSQVISIAQYNTVQSGGMFSIYVIPKGLLEAQLSSNEGGFGFYLNFFYTKSVYANQGAKWVIDSTSAPIGTWYFDSTSNDIFYRDSSKWDYMGSVSGRKGSVGNVRQGVLDTISLFNTHLKNSEIHFSQDLSDSLVITDEHIAKNELHFSSIEHKTKVERKSDSLQSGYLSSLDFSRFVAPITRYWNVDGLKFNPSNQYPFQINGNLYINGGLSLTERMRLPSQVLTSSENQIKYLGPKSLCYMEVLKSSFTSVVLPSFDKTPIYTVIHLLLVNVEAAPVSFSPDPNDLNLLLPVYKGAAASQITFTLNSRCGLLTLVRGSDRWYIRDGRGL